MLKNYGYVGTYHNESISVSRTLLTIESARESGTYNDHMRGGKPRKAVNRVILEQIFPTERKGRNLA